MLFDTSSLENAQGRWTAWPLAFRAPYTDFAARLPSPLCQQELWWGGWGGENHPTSALTPSSCREGTPWESYRAWGTHPSWESSPGSGGEQPSPGTGRGPMHQAAGEVTPVHLSEGSAAPPVPGGGWRRLLITPQLAT